MFLLKGENMALCNEYLTGGILACKVQDLRDAYLNCLFKLLNVNS